MIPATDSTVTMKNIREIGFVKKIERLPVEMSRACLAAVSPIGASKKAMRKGATANPNFCM